MITEVETFRLRDIAFEYLPSVKLQMKSCPSKYYWDTLYLRAAMRSSPDISDIEQSAIRLLQDIAMYSIPVTEDSEATREECREYSFNCITKSAKALALVANKVIDIQVKVVNPNFRIAPRGMKWTK